MDGSVESRAGSSSFYLSNVLEFDCNICWERPINPVETACGHIFCWPCMHHHLHGREMPCPVCRAVLSCGDNVSPIATDNGALLLYLPVAEQSPDDHEDSGSGYTMPAAERSHDDHDDRSISNTDTHEVVHHRAKEEMPKRRKQLKRLQRRVRREKRLLRNSYRHIHDRHVHAFQDI